MKVKKSLFLFQQHVFLFIRELVDGGHIGNETTLVLTNLSVLTQKQKILTHERTADGFVTAVSCCVKVKGHTNRLV